MQLMPLIEFTDKGLYCPQGNFYIDPWKPVEKALITHAHSDHARWGSSHTSATNTPCQFYNCAWATTITKQLTGANN